MSSVTRSAFFTMSHPAKMSHLRSGFPIIDDDPVVDPFAGASRIMDGRERMAWIETKRKQIEWDAETARLRTEQQG